MPFVMSEGRFKCFPPLSMLYGWGSSDYIGCMIHALRVGKKTSALPITDQKLLVCSWLALVHRKDIYWSPCPAIWKAKTSAWPSSWWGWWGCLWDQHARGCYQLQASWAWAESGGKKQWSRRPETGVKLRSGGLWKGILVVNSATLVRG